ncbi:MAG: hypothetical protein ACE366_04040 [Bradymonadia bacterium]
MSRPWGLATEEELQLDKDIEWFRPDPRSRLYPLWTHNSLWMALGLLISGFGVKGLIDGNDPLRLAALCVGLAIILYSMLRVVILTVRILSNETCVGVRLDGLLRREAGGEILVVPWRAIDAITAEQKQQRLVVATDLPEVGTFKVSTECMDIDAEGLSIRLLDARRKALMGLL